MALCFTAARPQATTGGQLPHDVLFGQFPRVSGTCQFLEYSGHSLRFPHSPTEPFENIEIPICFSQKLYLGPQVRLIVPLLSDPGEQVDQGLGAVEESANLGH